MKLADRRFLLCFGCQRGGTTWLNDQLRRHPDFGFPPRKELRYLDPIYVHDFNEIQRQRLKELRRRLWNDLGENPQPLDIELARRLAWNARYALVSRGDYTDQWYASLFGGCDSNKVTGDFSPDYSLLPEEGVAHLARLLPSAHLIFIMRNPVERIISGSTYVLRDRKKLAPEEAQQLVRQIAETKLQADFSDYRSILQHFEAHFSNNAIKVLFHEDISLDPMAFIKSVCDHVGVGFDTRNFEGAIQRSINRSPEITVAEETVADVCKRCLPLLEWLSARFGGHATKWLEQAKA